jgi:uncharacterized protein (DUF58 family)
VRRIDWNLTARTTVPHVRETIAERELETWLLVDRSASMRFGTADSEKHELAAAAAAAFAFLNSRAGNRTGALLVGADGLTTLPARGGRTGALALVHSILAADDPTDGSGRGDLAAALLATGRVSRRRGLIVVISDFLDDGPWPAALRGLAMRHEVVAVEVRDPREDDLPAIGLLTLVDPETGQRREVHTGSARLRTRFAEAAAEQRAATGRAIRGAGARHLVLSTDRDWLLDIARAVMLWKRRR